MLKNVCCGAIIPTMSLLLTPCLSVKGITLLLFFFGYYYGIFLIQFFVRKNFCPSLYLAACEGLNEKGFSCSANISLIFFLDLMVSVMWFLNFFQIDVCHVFVEVMPFLLTLILLNVGNS